MSELNPLNQIWKDHKDQELFHQQKRRELEAVILAEGKTDGFKITKSYTKTWNQVELKNIEQTTDFPLHNYFEMEYKPIAAALKELPKELEIALTIKENKPSFALKEKEDEKN